MLKSIRFINRVCTIIRSITILLLQDWVFRFAGNHTLSYILYSKSLKSQDLRFVTYVWYFYKCSNINTVVKKLIIEFAYNHFNFGGIHLSNMQICRQKVKTSLPVWKHSQCLKWRFFYSFLIKTLKKPRFVATI